MPAEQTSRELKLVQYLMEAHGLEKELETALQTHISMAEKATYKKRLQDHLKETKAQAKAIEKRVKQLGGAPDGLVPDPIAGAAAAAGSVASKGVALAKGPIHALRGTGVAEKQLKNAQSELADEHKEIANYVAIEALADALGDRDTAKLARDHRKQEERMASFLQKVIPQLTKDVVREEIPAAERRASTNGAAPRSRSTSRSGSGRSTSSRSGASRSSSSSSSSRSRTAAKSSGTSSRSTAGRAKSTTAKRSGSSSAAKSTGGRAKSTTAKRSSSSSSSSSSRSRSTGSARKKSS